MKVLFTVEDYPALERVCETYFPYCRSINVREGQVQHYPYLFNQLNEAKTGRRSLKPQINDEKRLCLLLIKKIQKKQSEELFQTKTFAQNDFACLKQLIKHEFNLTQIWTVLNLRHVSLTADMPRHN